MADSSNIIEQSFRYAIEGLKGKWETWLLLIIMCIIFPLFLGYMLRNYIIALVIMLIFLCIIAIICLVIPYISLILLLALLPFRGLFSSRYITLHYDSVNPVCFFILL